MQHDNTNADWFSIAEEGNDNAWIMTDSPVEVEP